MHQSTAHTRPRWFFANLVEVKLTREATGGAMSIVELSGPCGDIPPLHLHRTDDEAWYLLEGQMSFFVGSDEPIAAGPGELVFGPKGIPHTIRVDSSEPARWLAICTPGDFAGFVLAASPRHIARAPACSGRAAEPRRNRRRCSARAGTSN